MRTTNSEYDNKQYDIVLPVKVEWTNHLETDWFKTYAMRRGTALFISDRWQRVQTVKSVTLAEDGSVKLYTGDEGWFFISTYNFYFLQQNHESELQEEIGLCFQAGRYAALIYEMRQLIENYILPDNRSGILKKAANLSIAMPPIQDFDAQEEI